MYLIRFNSLGGQEVVAEEGGAWGTSLSTHGGAYQSRISIPIVCMFSIPTPPLYQAAASLEGVLALA